MNEEKYFVISATEDGDVCTDVYTKEEFVRKVNGEDWGDPSSFFSKFPEEGIMYWGNRQLAIKGKIVAPKAVDRVTEWEIE